MYAMDGNNTPNTSKLYYFKKRGEEEEKNPPAPLPPLFPPRGLAEIFLNYRLFQ